MSTASNAPVISPEAAAAQTLMQLSTGYVASTGLYVAVTLRIADRIEAGTRGAAALARATGMNEDALYRVLRSLASLGIFEETAPREFSNNTAASLLRSDVPGSFYYATWRTSARKIKQKEGRKGRNTWLDFNLSPSRTSANTFEDLIAAAVAD